MLWVLLKAFLRFIFLPMVNVVTCNVSLWRLNTVQVVVSNLESSCTVFSTITKTMEVPCSHCHKMIDEVRQVFISSISPLYNIYIHQNSAIGICNF